MRIKNRLYSLKRSSIGKRLERLVWSVLRRYTTGVPRGSTEWLDTPFRLLLRDSGRRAAFFRRLAIELRKERLSASRRALTPRQLLDGISASYQRGRRSIQQPRTEQPSSKQAAAKKALAKRAPVKKAAVKRAPAKKAPAKRAPAKKAAVKRAPAKKAPAKRAPVKKAAVKRAPAKKAPAKRAPVKKAAVKRAPAKKAPAKRAPVKKAAVKRAPAKKAPAKRAPAKKAAVKKTRAKRVGDKPDSPDQMQKGSENSSVCVFFATDRQPLQSSESMVKFGSERQRDGKLIYGTCSINIPKGHRTGHIESPSWLHLELRPNPNKHIFILETITLDEEVFLGRVASAVADSQAKDAFIFVHGYNCTFEDAALRTGQMAFDLSFIGAPILYSWPSKGHIRDYPADETNVSWTSTHFERFLDLIATGSGAKRIHVIAHSMGNRSEEHTS